jgi:hypothetical protein
MLESRLRRDGPISLTTALDGRANSRVVRGLALSKEKHGPARGYLPANRLRQHQPPFLPTVSSEVSCALPGKLSTSRLERRRVPGRRGSVEGSVMPSEHYGVYRCGVVVVLVGSRPSAYAHFGVLLIQDVLPVARAVHKPVEHVLRCVGVCAVATFG